MSDMRQLIDLAKAYEAMSEAYDPNESAESREARMVVQRQKCKEAAEAAAAILGTQAFRVTNDDNTSWIVHNGGRANISFHVWGGASVEIRRITLNEGVAFAQWLKENNDGGGQPDKPGSIV
jgi:hypothetical protein